MILLQRSYNFLNFIIFYQPLKNSNDAVCVMTPRGNPWIPEVTIVE